MPSAAAGCAADAVVASPSDGAAESKFAIPAAAAAADVDDLLPLALRLRRRGGAQGQGRVERMACTRTVHSDCVMFGGGAA